MHLKKTVHPESLYYECEEFWKPGMLLDMANRQRISETASLIPSEVHSVIDVGCGNGVFLDYLSRHYAFSLLGVDRSRTALEHVTTSKLRADITRIPVTDQSFDCLTCLEVLEHVPDPEFETALRELTRISRKYIILSVPDNEKLGENTTTCPSCRAIFNKDLHFRSFTTKDLKELLEPYGFRCLLAKNIIPQIELWGYKYYQALFKVLNKKEKKFQSPICPVCGYQNKDFEIPVIKDMTDNRKNSQNNPIKGLYHSSMKLLKQYWPVKQTPGYWALALYTKIGTI